MLKQGLLIFSFVLIFTAIAGLYSSFADTNANADNLANTVKVVETDSDTVASDLIHFSTIDIPPLPFDDNPDPTACGIPQLWQSNKVAYLNGVYEGNLIQPVVYLYDSHGRNAIVAAAEHGTEVEVMMFQANPVLNYYYVKIPSAAKGVRMGWVPAPFLSFDAVDSNKT